MIPLLLYLLADAGATAAKPEEFQAKHWVNLTYRMQDNRSVVVFVFDAKARESRNFVPKLNRLQRRTDLLVIGLTHESKSTTDAFIRQCRAKFPIGCESRDAKRLARGKLPILLFYDRQDEKREPQALPEDQLGAMAGAAPQDWGDVSKLDDPARLREYVASDQPGQLRATGLRRLRPLLPPEVFIELADELLSDEADPWMRAALEYHRDVARGIRPDDDAPAPSSRYLSDYSSNADAPQWAGVNEFRSAAPSMSVAQLLAEYERRPGDSPSDTVIRRMVVHHLHHNAADKRAARDALLQILNANERDHSIRLMTVMALGDVCEVGDIAAADALLAHAQREPNLLRVRPMMQYLENYLRTGEEDPAQSTRE